MTGYVLSDWAERGGTAISLLSAVGLESGLRERRRSGRGRVDTGKQKIKDRYYYSEFLPSLSVLSI